MIMKSIRFDQWELREDRHNWVLIRHYIGKKKKTGEPVPQTDETFHRDIPQVANWILNREAKECLEASEGLEGLKAALQERGDRLVGILQEIANQS